MIARFYILNNMPGAKLVQKIIRLTGIFENIFLLGKTTKTPILKKFLVLALGYIQTLF